MPWIVGIDEAGYGPNLGPLVMTSVACRIPAELEGGDLWRVLRSAVRRHPSADDGRLLVEDSKLIYSTTRGLHALEKGVLAALCSWAVAEEVCLAHYIDRVCPAAHPELRGEPWYAGTSRLPARAEPGVCQKAGRRFQRACARKGVIWGLVRSVVVCPRRFNELLDQWGSKAAALGQGLADLLRCNRRPDDEAEPMTFFVDKHGGRNYYAALLQHALPDGLVVAHAESLDRSEYSVLGLERPMRLVFQPRADAEHFCVALASMVSKYLRELLMLEFNQFWQAQVPGLKPTAGYPGDSARFLAEIRDAIERLAIPEAALWRRK